MDGSRRRGPYKTAELAPQLRQFRQNIGSVRVSDDRAVQPQSTRLKSSHCELSVRLPCQVSHAPHCRISQPFPCRSTKELRYRDGHEVRTCCDGLHARSSLVYDVRRSNLKFDASYRQPTVARDACSCRVSTYKTIMAALRTDSDKSIFTTSTSTLIWPHICDEYSVNHSSSSTYTSTRSRWRQTSRTSSTTNTRRLWQQRSSSSFYFYRQQACISIRWLAPAYGSLSRLY